MLEARLPTQILLNNIHDISEVRTRWILKRSAAHEYNVSPGAAIARADGDTREQAKAEAFAQAKERLARTRRFKV